MKTIKDNEILTETERMEILRLAKGGSWYVEWKPYCVNCSYSLRMEQKTFGFKCSNCNNLIGWDLRRLQESPLNFRKKSLKIKKTLELQESN
jgi:tRNA(Ile2) C34 agmatinyltransferase TiaS